MLDKLSLDHIVLVERIEGQPNFARPGDDENLQQWAERFAPGSLGSFFDPAYQAIMPQLVEKEELALALCFQDIRRLE